MERHVDLSLLSVRTEVSGGGWVISGHQEFFYSNLVGRIFFPFFPISFPLHLCCMQFFSSDKPLQESFFRNHHPVYKTTSLLRPYSFKPNVKTIESFYYFEDPVNATTSFLRPGFYGPTVVGLAGFHCTIG